MMCRPRFAVLLAAVLVSIAWLSHRISAASESEANGPLFGIDSAAASGRAISLIDVIGIRDIQSLAVSPDGRSVAFQVTQAEPALNIYRNAWYTVPARPSIEARFVDNAGPVRINQTGVGNLHGGVLGWPVAWSPDGRWLVYLKEANGEVQIWGAPQDGGAPEQLTHNSADVMDMAWAPDSSTLYYTVGRDRASMEKATAMEAQRGFLLDERIKPSYSAAPLWAPCASKERRFSRLDLMGSKVERCAQKVWVLDIGSRVERSAANVEAIVYWELRRTDNREYLVTGRADMRAIVPSPDDASVAWLENPDPEAYPGAFPPLTVSVSRARDRNDSIQCTDPLCTGRIEQLWWRASTGEVVFQGMETDGTGFELGGAVGNQPTINVLNAWKPGSRSARRILRSDDSLQNCEIADDRLICIYNTWTRPDRIVAIDLDSGSVKTIFDTNPEFASFDFTRIEKIESSNALGHKMIGHLVYPVDYEAGRRYPLVTVNYTCIDSGAFLRGGTGDELPIHVLAQHGFVVLCYAPSAISVDSALPLLEQMVERLDERGIVDPARVGISGLSAGASMVDDAIVTSNRFTAAHAAYSPFHPVSYYLLPTAKFRKRKREKAGGDPFSGGLEYWSKMSPGIHAQTVGTPLLLQVADKEMFFAVPNFYSLKDAGKPVEMYIFPDEYHIKTQPAHKYAVYKRNLQWFKFWLQGIEEPDPLDPEQYGRWRNLRDDHCANIKGEGESQLPVYCEGDN